jgi:hypothetical protein
MKMHVQVVGGGGGDLIDMCRYEVQLLAFVNKVMNIHIS